MSNVFNEVAVSSLISLITHEEKNGSMMKLFSDEDTFISKIETIGLSYLKASLVKLNVSEQLVDSLVNREHALYMAECLLDLSEFFNRRNLQFSNGLSRLIQKQLISYLESGKSHKNKEAKHSLLLSEQIAKKVINSKNGKVIEHEIFQDLNFLSSRVKVDSASSEIGPSIMSYVCDFDSWFLRGVGENLNTFSKEFWLMETDGSTNKKNILDRAVRVNPKILLIHEGIELSDHDKEKQILLLELLDKAPKILNAVKYRIDEDSAPYDLSFIFNKSVQNVLNQTVFFAEESNVQYVLANATRFGISPICMIRKGVPSEVIFLRMISKYCNSKGFDLMLPAFREFNVLDTCNIQTSFAFASSFSFMASTWDAKTGYQISLEAEKIFLSQLESFLASTDIVDIDQIENHITNGYGLNKFKESFQRVYSKVAFSIHESSKSIDESSISLSLY